MHRVHFVTARPTAGISKGLIFLNGLISDATKSKHFRGERSPSLIKMKEFTSCPLKFDERTAIGSEAVNVLYLVPFTPSTFPGKGRALGISSHCFVRTALSWRSSALLQSPDRGTPKCSAKGIAGELLQFGSCARPSKLCCLHDTSRTDGLC